MDATSLAVLAGIPLLALLILESGVPGPGGGVATKQERPGGAAVWHFVEAAFCAAYALGVWGSGAGQLYAAVFAVVLGIPVVALLVREARVEQEALIEDTSAVESGATSKRQIAEVLLCALYFLGALALAASDALRPPSLSLLPAPLLLLDATAIAFTLLRSYGLAYSREAHSRVPAHFLPALRRPRRVAYFATVQRRLYHVRAWWAASGVAVAVAAVRAGGGSGPIAALFDAAAAHPLLAAVMAARLALAALATWSVAACSAADYAGRASEGEGEWLWGAGTEVGEHPCQRAPPRLLAQGGGGGVAGALPPRPLRIVVLTVGTRGDVQPFVALACALRDAGHSPVIAAARDHKALIRRHGVAWADLGVEEVNQDAWPGVTSVAGMITASGPLLVRDYPTVAGGMAAACGLGPSTTPSTPRPDLIIGTAMTLTFALNIGEAGRIPVWFAKLAPDMPTPGFALPGRLPSPIGIVNLLASHAYWLSVAFAVWRTGISAAEEEFRASLGLPRAIDAGVRIAALGHTPTLLGYSSVLMPKPVDYPAWAFQCGFWQLGSGAVGEAPAGPSPALTAFVNDGDAPPEAEEDEEDEEEGGRLVAAWEAARGLARGVDTRLVVVTFGSMAHPPRLGLLDDILTVLLQPFLRLRVVVLTGRAGVGEGGAHVNPRVHYAVEAPHEWLFRHAMFVVHHGGAGTTAAALSCGAGQLIVPVLRWADQPLWGWLVRARGVGTFITDPAVPFRALQAGVDAVLAGTRESSPFTHSTMCDAANRAGATLRAERAADAAVALLESCLCNLVLPPAEADAIAVDAEAADPARLSPAQRMCLRSCVPCSRARAEAAEGAAALAASTASSALGASALSDASSSLSQSAVAARLSFPAASPEAGGSSGAGATPSPAPVASSSGKRRRAGSGSREGSGGAGGPSESPAAAAEAVETMRTAGAGRTPKRLPSRARSKGAAAPAPATSLTADAGSTPARGPGARLRSSARAIALLRSALTPR